MFATNPSLFPRWLKMNFNIITNNQKYLSRRERWQIGVSACMYVCAWVYAAGGYAYAAHIRLSVSKQRQLKRRSPFVYHTCVHNDWQMWFGKNCETSGELSPTYNEHKNAKKKTNTHRTRACNAWHLKRWKRRSQPNVSLWSLLRFFSFFIFQIKDPLCVCYTFSFCYCIQRYSMATDISLSASSCHYGFGGWRIQCISYRERGTEKNHFECASSVLWAGTLRVGCCHIWQATRPHIMPAPPLMAAVIWRMNKKREEKNGWRFHSDGKYIATDERTNIE